MDEFEILSAMEKNSNDPILFEFLKELFSLEYNYESDWEKKYDKFIDKYYDKRIPKGDE